ncbi:CDP-glycerol glycerophosphotransferase [Burkholderia diffusa]|uniref:CDP-glycerol glycerophosphotransferase n=1 Tax=Burkholderia diffusa TaxID=488732 RepID=A0AAW3P7G6_9BURK|nr:CDP-glycerol glycerophosphotransferase family protein [Burkholderia diffusa]KVN02958.1 CDP-glycerol glycerophosphotransferase [Burkholderia diffusa]KWF41358.1 CDP-glycerol glycerophosphotransferase [Burkholderia diffusa]KWF44184.1 CDP-glycerol glycerophosphotransferase [Burkholderia diffusa]KWF45092.1 CDP-glycerol glycerophosphotransferase [Burkholderia diffusa]KWF51075.1 CDP-glycerol glycerophosphotransferase [Burkholderia diffusa]
MGETTTKKRIRFLFQTGCQWYCYDSVYEAFCNDDRYDVEIVALPFTKNGVQIGDPAWIFLEEQGLPFVHYQQYDLDADVPDVVFLHNPYDETRPDAYHAKALSERGIRLAYIPYGPDMGDGEANRYFQYRMDTQTLAWRIFARSENHRQRFKTILPGSIRRVVATGHPKVDRTHDSMVDNPLRKRFEGRKVLLWNPHFSVGFPANLRWSTFDRYLKTFCDLVMHRHDVAIIMRPHPNLFYTLMHSDVGKQAIRMLIALAKSHPHFVIDQSALYRHAFDASHALITDTSSLMYEYLVCDKPILHLECEGGGGVNAEARQMLQGMANARSEHDIVEFVNAIASGQDVKRTKRQRVIADVLGKRDGKNGSRIKQAVDQSDLWC